MDKKEKKFNVALFIVLLILCFPAGIIYGIVSAVKANKAKKGIVNNDGFTAKMICGIVSLINSIVFLIIGGGSIAIMAMILSILLVLFSILNKKLGKKILFNLIYLFCLIIVIGGIVVFSFLFQPLLLIIVSPMIICSIFGIVGVVRGLKA